MYVLAQNIVSRLEYCLNLKLLPFWANGSLGGGQTTALSKRLEIKPNIVTACAETLLTAPPDK